MKATTVLAAFHKATANQMMIVVWAIRSNRAANTDPRFERACRQAVRFEKRLERICQEYDGMGRALDGLHALVGEPEA